MVWAIQDYISHALWNNGSGKRTTKVNGVINGQRIKLYITENGNNIIVIPLDDPLRKHESN